MKLSALTSIRYAATTAVAVVVLSSCSLGGSTVPQEELEKDVAAQLNEQSGQDNDATCEGDLEAEEDATQQCSWESDDGAEIPVEVTATAVGDEDVEYRIEPQEPVAGSGDSEDPQGSEEPTTGTPIAQDVLEQEVRSFFKQETGKSFPVSCEGELEGEVGATQRCTWNASDGSTLGVDVKLTGYSGGQANFHIQADDKATPAPKS
ncbi:MAG: DUF4333 domain-containing protein [Nocardioidaceae bacterium]